MSTRFFTDKDRPVHMGPYPCERLARADQVDLADVPEMKPLVFARQDAPFR